MSRRAHTHTDKNITSPCLVTPNVVACVPLSYTIVLARAVISTQVQIGSLVSPTFARLFDRNFSVHVLVCVFVRTIKQQIIPSPASPSDPGVPRGPLRHGGRRNALTPDGSCPGLSRGPRRHGGVHARAMANAQDSRGARAGMKECTYCPRLLLRSPMSLAQAWRNAEGFG